MKLAGSLVKIFALTAVHVEGDHGMILVTGVTGRTGAEVLRNVITLQAPVRVLVRSTDAAEQFQRLERHVVEAAQQSKVEHIVKLSILGASSDSACLMLKWHRQIEQQIEASGLAYTFLRPNLFMQGVVSSHARTIATEGYYTERMARPESVR